MSGYKRPLLRVLFLAAVGVTCNRHCQAATSSPAGTRREIVSVLASAFPETAEKRRLQAKRFLAAFDAAEDLPAAERTRLRLRLKSRLTRLASGIRQDLSKKRRAAASQAAPLSAASTAGDTVPRAGRAGGGPQNEGQALVDLIEATIASETWDVNGGPGAIKYWPAWQVLVVRQTDEAHEQLGGVVRGLRK